MRLVLRDRKETQELRVRLVLRVRPARKEHKGQLVHKDRKET